MALMMITHDLGVIADICDRVVVMYLGEVVESGTVHEVFTRTLHPYTEALLNSIPRPGYGDEPAGGDHRQRAGSVHPRTRLPVRATVHQARDR